jgi:AhpD family alkylhydroperoxidase
MDMREALGIVPSFFKRVPDKELEEDWTLFKKLQLAEGAIPTKYRHLIGIGISAATRCRYCTFFHTEAARLLGASDEEIEEAMHFAKESTGWSTYLNGMQVDLEQFKKVTRQIVEYVSSKEMAGQT